MKNYDVKSSKLDLITKSEITVTGKRLAYLVSNMFNKITSGYSKKTAILVNSNVQESTVISNAATSVIKEDAVKIEAGENTVSINGNQSNIEVEKPKNENIEVSEKTKNYIIKALQLDIDYLKNNHFHITSVPRKLLISTVFVQKLVAHRTNVVKTNIEVKKEEPIVVIKTPEFLVDTKEAGVAKYVGLMSKRKEAIAAKQTYEKEMTELVNKFGITLDMVNAELAKGNMEKIG